MLNRKRYTDFVSSMLPKLIAFLLLSVSSTHAIMAGGEFDLPSDSPSNRLETIIGPGDSGGSLLVGNALVGVNTFTEGYGGLFGDYGGGIALNSEWDWISETTGLAVPEPSTLVSVFVGSLVLYLGKRKPQ